MAKPKIVVIGGGAISEAILPAIKDFPAHISTITSMTDSGGSNGALRKEFDIHPAGDIRRHILALSDAEQWKKDIWNFRFAKDIVWKGGHRGHNFANVFMAGLEKSTNDFEKTLGIAHNFMKVRGQCLPATLDKVNLFAKLENGAILSSEDEIDVPENRDEKRRNTNLKITNLWLQPKARAYKKALDAIKEAKYIVIGPGDLYSSVLACFLSVGIKDAMKKTKAKIIYVCNIPNKPGETKGMNAGDYLSEVVKYIGIKKLDYAILNDSGNKKGKEEMVKADIKECSKFANRIIISSLAKKAIPIHHDPSKLKRIFKKILE